MAAHLVTDKLDKPEIDTRSYRIIRLDNELEVLLVSDPDTDKASAALDVHVGHLSDPPNAPGLAHFCEHLLFMGTEKYPEENNYSEFLSQHSGASNAYTATVDTNYFFEVGHEYLEPALDRFSQFFISPLFLESCKEREKMAVDSENKKNLQNDTWRAYQLEKSLSNPDHVYSKFGTGNAETLNGSDVRDQLLKFHAELYSANQMKLVLLGRNSLDELESMAVSKFSEVKNKQIGPPEFEGEVLRLNRELGSVYTFKPVKEVRNIEICFPIPECSKLWRSQPSHYFAHLIGHEGEGSILSYLKKQGWVLYLGAGGSDATPGTDFFKISMELTLPGLENWRSIVEVVFAYINILKKEGIQEWIWKENQLCSEAAFQYRERQPASRFTSGIAGKLHLPIDRQFLLSTDIPREFVKSELELVLSALRTDNFRVALADPGVVPDRTEKWYGTEYRLDRLPKDLLANCAPDSKLNIVGLHLPAKNDFIPENFETNRKEVKEKAKQPTLLKHTSTMRLHHKKDDTFWVPKANYIYQIRSPLMMSSAQNAVMSKLFIELLKDALGEYSYPADVAGLQYAVDPVVGGLTLTFSGYNDKMAVLVEKVLQRMKSLTILEDRFIIEKDRLERDLRNFEYDAPYSQVSYHMSYVLAQTIYSKEEQIQCLPSISFDMMKDFANSAFEACHVEILAHGNITSSEATAAAELFEKIMQPKALEVKDTKALPALWMPVGSHVYSRKLKDESDINSAIEYFVQVGPSYNAEERAICTLFAQICSEPAFNQLRTKEQLGYIVFSGTKVTLTSHGFRILIQSEKPASFLASRIDAFLDFIKTVISEMTDAELDVHRKSVIDKLNESLKNIAQETKRYWSHISSGLYDFDAIDVQTKYLTQTTRSQVEQFFNDRVHYSSPTRRHVSVYMSHQDEEGIKDIRQFKQQCQVIPLKDGLSQSPKL